jgi:hypothetical protein
MKIARHPSLGNIPAPVLPAWGCGKEGKKGMVTLPYDSEKEFGDVSVTIRANGLKITIEEEQDHEEIKVGRPLHT